MRPTARQLAILSVAVLAMGCMATIDFPAGAEAFEAPVHSTYNANAPRRVDLGLDLPDPWPEPIAAPEVASMRAAVGKDHPEAHAQRDHPVLDGLVMGLGPR
jgi:hypothetical protein